MQNFSEPSPRQQLLQLQHATFARLEEDLHVGQFSEPLQLRRYRRRYDREVSKFQKISNKSELIGELKDASIVYCGDYHTLRQAQRTAVRILKAILLDRRVYLGLELVPHNGEKLANDYVRKRTSEENFLTNISYDKRWGFPWSHYRDLFVLARQYNVRLIGLNSDEGDQLNLEERDQLAAELLVKHLINSEDILIFCLYGDLHIGSGHIPRKVEKLLKSYGVKKKSVTIFQNSESIYWQLSLKNLENQVDVVKIGSRKFCVLSAAPWIKWQSYQSWIEDQSDLLDFPEDGENETTLVSDYYHQVLEIAQKIANFLKFTPLGLEHFSVLTAHDVKIIDEVDRYCSSCERRDFPITSVIRSEIIENGSCFFPETSVLYLSNLSENRAAEKAAQLLFTKMNPTPASVVGQETSRAEILYRLILWEAVGFLGSKIINPKRKCDRYKDFERVLIQTRGRKLLRRQRDQRELARILLAFRSYEIRRIKTGKKHGLPRKIFRIYPRLFYRCANALGHILADNLYYLMVTDRISLDSIRELFSPLDAHIEAGSQRYWKFLYLVRSFNFNHESKDDRF